MPRAGTWIPSRTPPASPRKLRVRCSTQRIRERRNLLAAAQRGDNPIFTLGGSDFALGSAILAQKGSPLGNVVDRDAACRAACPSPWSSCVRPPTILRRARTWPPSDPHNLHDPAADDDEPRAVCRELACAPSLQAGDEPGGGSGRCHGRHRGGRLRPSRAGERDRRAGRPGAQLQPHGAGPRGSRAQVERSTEQLSRPTRHRSAAAASSKPCSRPFPNGVATLGPRAASC